MFLSGVLSKPPPITFQRITAVNNNVTAIYCSVTAPFVLCFHKPLTLKSLCFTVVSFPLHTLKAPDPLPPILPPPSP